MKLVKETCFVLLALLFLLALAGCQVSQNVPSIGVVNNDATGIKSEAGTIQTAAQLLPDGPIKVVIVSAAKKIVVAADNVIAENAITQGKYDWAYNLLAGFRDDPWTYWGGRSLHWWLKTIVIGWTITCVVVLAMGLTTPAGLLKWFVVFAKQLEVFLPAMNIVQWVRQYFNPASVTVGNVPPAK